VGGACGDGETPPEHDHDHGDHDHGDGDHPAPPMRSDGGFEEPDAGPDDLLQLPPGFPEPLTPEDNPLSAEKIELGRRLFYDPRISVNDEQSCASCHDQALAFTDGLARSVGTTGQAHPRSSMSLGNVAYLNVFTWGNPVMDTLEQQTLVPMFGSEPIELGLVDEETFVQKLRGVAFYQDAFAQAFPGDAEPITLEHAVQAITSFERTLI
jgi:cytochrome c peroxidase